MRGAFGCLFFRRTGGIESIFVVLCRRLPRVRQQNIGMLPKPTRRQSTIVAILDREGLVLPRRHGARKARHDCVEHLNRFRCDLSRSRYRAVRVMATVQRPCLRYHLLPEDAAEDVLRASTRPARGRGKRSRGRCDTGQVEREPASPLLDAAQKTAKLVCCFGLQELKLETTCRRL